MRVFIGGVIVASIVMVVSSAPVKAGTVQVVDVFDHGFYRDDGVTIDSSHLYSIGRSGGDVYRSFFIFNLSGLPAGDITAATLDLRVGNDPDDAPMGLELGLWDVSDVDRLRNPSGAGEDIFDDLGSGVGFVNNFDVRGQLYEYDPDGPAGPSEWRVKIDLTNLLTLASLNSAVGGLWAFGAAVDNLPDSGNIIMFNPGTNMEDHYLTLEISNTVVPTPTAAAGAMGLLSIGALRRRRRDEAIAD